MCYVEPATTKTWKCGHTTLDPETDTPVMCIPARAAQHWCDPHERASKGSSKSRQFDCPTCRNKKKPDPKGGGEGSTGAGGSTSAVQAQQPRISVGA